MSWRSEASSTAWASSSSNLTAWFRSLTPSGMCSWRWQPPSTTTPSGSTCTAAPLWRTSGMFEHLQPELFLITSSVDVSLSLLYHQNTMIVSSGCSKHHRLPVRPCNVYGFLTNLDQRSVCVCVSQYCHSCNDMAVPCSSVLCKYIPLKADELWWCLTFNDFSVHSDTHAHTL